MQTRHGQEVRDTEARECVTHLAREPPAFTQREGRKQRTARAGGGQRVCGAQAPSQHGSEWPGPRIRKPHHQRGVYEPRDHGHPLPTVRVPVDSASVTGIAPAGAAAHPGSQVQAISGDEALENRGRGEVRRLYVEPKSCGKRHPGRIQGQRAVEVVARPVEAAPHPCDLRLESHLAWRVEAPRSRVGIEWVLEVEGGGAEHAQCRPRSARHAALGEQGARERQHGSDQRAARIQPAAVGDQDAQDLGKEECRKGVRQREPGTGSALRLPRARVQCSRLGTFTFTQVFMRVRNAESVFSDSSSFVSSPAKSSMRRATSFRSRTASPSSSRPPQCTR